MKIGIVGAGNIGSVLARTFSAAGHEVRLANSRGPDTLRDLAADTGATPATVAQALEGADVVIVTIPEKNVPDLPRSLFAGLPDHVVVVDTGNYYPVFRDPRVETIEGGLPESAWVSQQLGRPVIKAFNNISAVSLASKGRPPGAEDRIGLPIAGDDPRGKEVVMGLVDAAGFDAVDAGGLAESWRQQPGTPVYGTDLKAADIPRALAKTDKAEAPERRDAGLRKAGLI